MKKQHKIKALIKPTLSFGRIVTLVYAKFSLLNLGIFMPTIVAKIIKKIKRKRAGMDYPFYNSIINRDDIRVVFDVGANIGSVTLAAARSFPNSHIYSFEPVRVTYQILCENIKNYSERITTYNFGFFNVSKRLDIHITSFHGANSILDQSLNHKNIHPHIIRRY